MSLGAIYGVLDTVTASRYAGESTERLTDDAIMRARRVLAQQWRQSVTQVTDDEARHFLRRTQKDGRT